MSRSMSDPVWHGMTREALDRAFNNGAAVADSAAIVAGWEARSAVVRQRPGAHLDLAYGQRPRNRIDYFPALPGAPTLAFIHGGYWQMRSKDTFTFAAEGPLARGIGVAMIGYTLAPEASLDEMVVEIRRALDFLSGHLADLGGDAGALWISGWSAGAHLAAMTLDHPRLCGGVAVSGLYDLEPIRLSYVNDKLGLDVAAAQRNSPMHNLAMRNVAMGNLAMRNGASSDRPLAVVVGGAELPQMIRQSADFAAERARQGLPGLFDALAGENHFSIVEQLARPDGRLTDIVAAMIAA